MVLQWIANPRPSGLAGSIPAVGVLKILTVKKRGKNVKFTNAGKTKP